MQFPALMLNKRESLKKAAAKASSKTKEQIEKALTERPTKSTRGRKPQDEDDYITASKRKIAEWEEELKGMKRNEMTKKQYDSLYNKKTAL